MLYNDKEISNFMDALKIGIGRSTYGSAASLLFVNAAFSTMLGYKKNEMVGMKFADLFENKKSFRDLLALLAKKVPVEGVEVSFRLRRGGLIWVAVSITIEEGRQGKPRFLDLVIEDITRRKATEKDLVRSKELFKVVFDHSAAAITVSDEQEKIVAWNPFAEKMLEMTREELFNKPVKDLYPEREWRKMRKLKIRQKGLVSGIVTQVIKKDGSLLDVDASISTLKDSRGKVIGTIGILRDITKQRRVQEMLVHAKLAAEEANSAKSLFLAKMSHELRTPMNAVLGMLELTLETPLTDEQKDNLKVAKDAATNLLGLLNDILDLSKAEAGKISIECLEISPRDVVKSVCKGIAFLAQNKGLELKHTIADDVPDLILGDPVRIRQIIINLVNNSIKFTHKGQVEVLLRQNARDGEETELFFSVRDTGIGIPPERINSLFEVFSQVDESTSRRFGGTGLGLVICKKLVEMMGGRIWIESEQGKGSRFNFILKFKVSSNNRPLSSGGPDAAAITIPETSSAEDVGRLHILLAEDNLVNQKIAVRILEKRGWAVMAVPDGKQAVDAIGKTHFDLILMDDHMPEMTGVEATAVIRTEEKQTGMHIPIVAMTANAMAGDRERYLAAGMDAYLSKPIDREALFQTIINLVKQRTSA